MQNSHNETRITDNDMNLTGLLPVEHEPVLALDHNYCLPFMEEMLCRNQLNFSGFFQPVEIESLDKNHFPNERQNTMFKINAPKDFTRITKES